MKPPSTNSEDLKSKAMKDKLDAIVARHRARIAHAERLEDNRQRKMDTRYKIVLGACVVAGIAQDPTLGPLVEAALKRNATPRDLELLRSRGWDL